VQMSPGARYRGRCGDDWSEKFFTKDKATVGTKAIADQEK